MNIMDCFLPHNKVIEALNKDGIFLTVKNRLGILNTMTIGWALFGIMWSEPICMVAVRPSRYTFKLLENADDFSLTIPFSDMRKQLLFCGTHSGRNIDKFKESGLTTTVAKNINSPVMNIKNSYQYECKIVQVSAMDKDRLDPKYDNEIYQDKSYHTYYFGRIVTCYEM